MNGDGTAWPFHDGAVFMPSLTTFEKVKLDPGLAIENNGLAHLQGHHIKTDCMTADYDQVWYIVGGVY